MTAPEDLLLAELTGEEQSTIYLRLTAHGLGVDGQDLGPSVRRIWDDGDYEYGIRVANADLPRLAFALIARHYRGNLQAVSELKRLATEHGIAANFWTYS